MMDISGTRKKWMGMLVMNIGQQTPVLDLKWIVSIKEITEVQKGFNSVQLQSLIVLIIFPCQLNVPTHFNNDNGYCWYRLSPNFMRFVSVSNNLF